MWTKRNEIDFLIMNEFFVPLDVLTLEDCTTSSPIIEFLTIDVAHINPRLGKIAETSRQKIHRTG